MELNIFFVLVRFLTIRSHGMQSADLESGAGLQSYDQHNSLFVESFANFIKLK
jgi:hypothetical protein